MELQQRLEADGECDFTNPHVSILQKLVRFLDGTCAAQSTQSTPMTFKILHSSNRRCHNIRSPSTYDGAVCPRIGLTRKLDIINLAA
jgi:hypothetical protein